MKYVARAMRAKSDCTHAVDYGPLLLDHLNMGIENTQFLLI